MSDEEAAATAASASEEETSSSSSSSEEETKKTKKRGAAKAKASAKTTTKRAKKDPSAPKRPLSSFMYFSQDVRPKLKAKHPDLSFGDLGRLLGEKWKALSAADKKPFEEKAAKDKARYDAEMKKASEAN